MRRGASIDRRSQAATRASTPKSILGAGCALWLRADLGITQATGVSLWSDQSGNGRNCSEATPSAQPTLLAGWKNGRPALNFSAAASQKLVGTAANIIADSAAWSALIVGARNHDPDVDNVGDKYPWFFFPASGAGHTLITFRIGGDKYVCTNTASSTTSSNFGFGTNPAYISWVDTGSAVPAVRVNGVGLTVATTRPATDGVTGYQVGGTHATDKLDGKIGEIVVKSGAFTAGELTALERYVRTFWGFP